MKISAALSVFMTAILLSCLHEMAAVGDCYATCDAGCQLEKNCNSVMCICTCNCATTQNNPPSTTQPPPSTYPTLPPPSTTQPPPTHNPTLPPPSTYNPTLPPPSITYPPPTSCPIQPNQPYVNYYNTQCCMNAGQRAIPCAGDYMMALIDPTLQFDYHCCQNLKDLQTYCVNGYLPLGVPPVNIFQYNLRYHCPGF